MVNLSQMNKKGEGMSNASAAEHIEQREIIGAPSTARVEKRYQDLLDNEPCIDSERAVLFTEYMKQH